MKNKGSKLTIFIIVAMVIGAVVGQLIFTGLPAIGSAQNPTGEINATYASYFKILTTIFLRLVQMIIAPLVITTLIVGIAKMGNLSAIGRVGGKSMLWFLTASLVSLLLGLVLVNYFEHGRNCQKRERIGRKNGNFFIQSFY